MANPIYSLPLRALLAFRAAGEHLNFTHAAKELNVTREAISGQIRTLETHLGVRLFQRLHRGLALTEAGQRLFDSVKLGFEAIGGTAQDLRYSASKPTVSITATVAFASSVLISKFPGFHAAHPGIDIRVIESDECRDLELDGIDIAIRYGDGNWPGLPALHLFDEETFPVCSPELATRNPELADIRNLVNHRFLHLSGAEHEREDWRHLLALAGVETPGDLRGTWFSNYSNVIQAARNSQGIAIGWRHIIDGYLKSGELINPTGQVYRTGRGFYLIGRRPDRMSNSARLLYDWLISEFRE